MNTKAKLKQILDYQNLNLESLPGELWKPLIGHEKDYQVSNLGRVKSLSKRRWNGVNFYYTKTKIMKQSTAKTGYLVVNIARKISYVHRIVLLSFVFDKDYKNKDVNHKDGNKTNNNLKNLEWNTRKQNINHAQKTGLNRLNNLKKATISEETAKKIIKVHKKTGYKKTLLKRHYFPNVSLSCLQGITDNKTWKHLKR